MKANRHNRGSVLMEFIIVFPIYLVLFGGVFMVGDMLVHATRLASAERTLAFDVNPFPLSDNWSRVRNVLFHNTNASQPAEISDTKTRALQDSLAYDKGPSAWYADLTPERYPFSLRAAVKVRDGYLLPAGGTAGRLLFAYQFLDDNTKPNNVLATHAPDILNLWQNQRMVIYSKGSSRSYNYFTLKRVRYTEKDDPEKKHISWRDNRRYASDLLAHSRRKRTWEDIYKEEWHQEVNDEETNRTQFPDPDFSLERADYQRYGQFVTWSE